MHAMIQPIIEPVVRIATAPPPGVRAFTATNAMADMMIGPRFTRIVS